MLPICTTEGHTHTNSRMPQEFTKSLPASFVTEHAAWGHQSHLHLPMSLSQGKQESWPQSGQWRFLSRPA